MTTRTIPLTLDYADYLKLKAYRAKHSKAKNWESFILELIKKEVHK